MLEVLGGYRLAPQTTETNQAEDEKGTATPFTPKK
jgi:hypothetical protein